MSEPMQAHYEQRMEADLEAIRAGVREVAEHVETQVGDAVRALLTGDRKLANAVILGDRGVNREFRAVDRLAHAFIVRHAPSGGHLRYVSAVMRMNVSMERVGDYAGTIGREVVQLTAPPPTRIARDIDLISQQCRSTLHQALAAFQMADAELARETHGLADLTDSTLRSVFAELLEAGEARELPLGDAFALLRIVNLIKRVAEQAENICEQVMFFLTGEPQDARVFRILFVDERNDGASAMAEAYARKAFPESGLYASAGWAPAEGLRAGLVAFLDRNGVDSRGKKPTRLRPIHQEPRHWNVVVALHPDVRAYIPLVPFKTVLLEWELSLDPTTLPADLTEEQMDVMFKDISVQVQDLMKLLRGPDAR
ncbi:MAG TPA: PhoU domain-containing protein [Longimicrobiales bacterium]|nr:PhoU domain-containing protein [Longimicrobiales bacterium]